MNSSRRFFSRYLFVVVAETVAVDIHMIGAVEFLSYHIAPVAAFFNETGQHGADLGRICDILQNDFRRSVCLCLDDVVAVGDFV